MVKFRSATDEDYRTTIRLINQIHKSSDRTRHAQELQALQLKSKSPLFDNSYIETLQPFIAHES